MAPLRVSTTKSEWLPDDPTAFVPTRLWKLPFITTWDDSRNQNRPTDSAEEAKGQAFTVSCAEPTFLHTSDAQASCASNATGSSGCLRWSSTAPTGENPGPAHPVSLAQ